MFSRDGRYLYGSSYYTGVSNIFRYEVATGDVEAVSNAETGFFRPVPLADGRLVVLAYTAEGFVPAMIDPKPDRGCQRDQVPRHRGRGEVPGRQDLAGAAAEHGRRRSSSSPRARTSRWRNLALANAYPVLQGYKNSVGIGYHFNFEDPLAVREPRHHRGLDAGNDLPGSERGHVDINGRYLGWRGALSWNRSDFYDLFGPTKRSRKGYAAKLGYDYSLIYDEPRSSTLVFDVAYYDQIDTLPNAQNVDSGFTRLVTGEVGLSYTDLRRSLGAVDDEKGVAWSLVTTATA